MSAVNPAYDRPMIGNLTTSEIQNTASGGTPLDAVVFDRLMMAFTPFETAPEILVGVSGGADSMALALLAHDWCQAQGGRVVAVTVDHGLRKAASDEARWVATELAQHNIEHITKHWQGEKPKGAVQEKARQARYQIFDDLMRDTGIFHLLVAHHAGDQRETIAMRRDRGTTLIGQAGMSARRYLRHGRVLRPLLGVAKADLVATLTARGQAWIEDPSNIDEKFERVRVRKAFAAGASHPPDITADASARRALETGIGRLLAGAVTLHANGVAILKPDVRLDQKTDRNAAIHALGQVVRTVGAQDICLHWINCAVRWIALVRIKHPASVWAAASCTVGKAGSAFIANLVEWRRIQLRWMPNHSPDLWLCGLIIALNGRQMTLKLQGKLDVGSHRLAFVMCFTRSLFAPHWAKLHHLLVIYRARPLHPCLHSTIKKACYLLAGLRFRSFPTYYPPPVADGLWAGA